MRFTAMEKDSGLSAKLTASAAIAHQHQGGRGYAYEICASYKIAGSKLKRFDLE